MNKDQSAKLVEKLCQLFPTTNEHQAEELAKGFVRLDFDVTREAIENHYRKQSTFVDAPALFASIFAESNRRFRERQIVAEKNAAIQRSKADKAEQERSDQLFADLRRDIEEADQAEIQRIIDELLASHLGKMVRDHIGKAKEKSKSIWESRMMVSLVHDKLACTFYEANTRHLAMTNRAKVEGAVGSVLVGSV